MLSIRSKNYENCYWSIYQATGTGTSGTGLVWLEAGLSVLWIDAFHLWSGQSGWLAGLVLCSQPWFISYPSYSEWLLFPHFKCVERRKVSDQLISRNFRYEIFHDLKFPLMGDHWLSFILMYVDVSLPAYLLWFFMFHLIII